ncbi:MULTISPECIES: septal ring lytic transglycosylase RlpA family protein [unclassified Moraxella]|uniref:septal ring lytic transglycosylase RlpA family protein n=1 Tax=unclassified Moraxella TaxID=2685852 RepID=UPI003AF799B9
MKKYVLVSLLMVATTAQANVASWYGGKHHGRKTASGEVFNQYALTAASNVHKLGSKLKVTNKANGKSVIVRVTDTGGFGKYGRTLDLSKGAFSQIASLSSGLAKVTIEQLD